MCDKLKWLVTKIKSPEQYENHTDRLQSLKRGWSVPGPAKDTFQFETARQNIILLIEAESYHLLLTWNKMRTDDHQKQEVHFFCLGAGLLPAFEGQTPVLANVFSLAIHSPFPMASWVFGFMLIW